jgi:hypothetical protein
MTSTMTENMSPARPTDGDWIPDVDAVIAVVPSERPLYFRDNARGTLREHTSAMGVARPTSVRVMSRENNTDPTNGAYNASGNLRVRWTGASGTVYETWAFVSEFVNPNEPAVGGYDFSTFRRTVEAWVRGTTLNRSGGGVIAHRGDLRDTKVQSIVDAAVAVAQGYLDGTRYGSEREVGSALWAEVARLSNERSVAWARNYTSDPIACDQMGAYLHSLEPTIAALPRVQSLNGIPPRDEPWEQTTVPFGAWDILDGSLVLVTEVHSDSSITYLSAGGTSRALPDNEHLRRITGATPLRPNRNQPDSLNITTDEKVYWATGRAPYLEGGIPRMRVAMTPNTRDSRGYITFRYLVVDMGALAPKPPKVDPVVEIDGVKYVPLAVIEKDIETMKTVIHKGADENGLCGVYDKVMAKSDDATDFLKMGGRPKRRVVRMNRNVEVSWYVEVVASSDDDARAQALDSSATIGAVPSPTFAGVGGFRSRAGEITVTEVAS